jgi:hypothetical protein
MQIEVDLFKHMQLRRVLVVQGKAFGNALQTQERWVHG